MANKSWRRRLIIGVIVTFALGLLLTATVMLLSKPRPVGHTGPDADELARAIERSTHKEEWDRTGAVQWSFGGRNRHLWDRKRSLARVSWGKTQVLLDLTSKSGQATQNGQRVAPKDERKLLDQAYAKWVNDSFWLNPLAKLFDDGVTRSVVIQQGGQQALLISYNSGGLTPGDAYLWIIGKDGRPEGWQMWVSIIPLKGLGTSWAGWTQLATGAYIATDHIWSGIGINTKIADLAGAATLAELVPGADPFAPLFGSP